MPEVKYKYRIVLFDENKRIIDIWEFAEKKRKDGFSAPLQNFLFTAFELKPEGGSVTIDKLIDD